MRWMKFLLMALLGVGAVLESKSAESEVTDQAVSRSGVKEPSDTSQGYSAVPTLDETPPPDSLPEPAPPHNEFEGVTLSTLSTNTDLVGVARQIRAGVEEEVLLNYISNSSVPFNIGSDEIIYLTDLGASGQLINAMMERDRQLRDATSESRIEPSPQEPWPAAGTVEQVPAATSGPTMAAASDVESVVVEAPATEVTVDYFYDQLAPYGRWVDIPGYGLCWQPSVALSTRGWMPYADRGRWIYSNYGWYWYSDYTWGWAVFHYGRWLHHDRWGWCWVPGTVWGPSWVTWRYADAYCGWAPLPPYSRTGFYFSVGVSWGIPTWCYTYVPAYRICNYYPRTCAVPYARARAIHYKSKVCDNYSVARNNTIQNRGIPPERLARENGAEIRSAQINERNEVPVGTTRRERMENSGRTLTVYRPDVERRTEPTARRTLTAASADGSESATTFGGTSRPTPVTRAEPSDTGRDRSASSIRRIGTVGRTESAARGTQSGTSRTPGRRDSAGGLSRSEPASRDRSTSAPVRAAGTDRVADTQSGSRTQPATESTDRRSSLIIIGRSDTPSTVSRVSPTVRTTHAQGSPGRSYSSESSSPSTARTPIRTEPVTQTRTDRSLGASATPSSRLTPTTRTLSTQPARPITQPTSRSITVNRISSVPSRTPAQSPPVSSYRAPVQRSAPPSVSSRTVVQPVRSSAPTQTYRSPAPASVTPRSTPTYSAPAGPVRAPGPAPSRTGRALESSGRSR